MTGPEPSVQAVRLAVRRGLSLLAGTTGGRRTPGAGPSGCVLVACSGGADSLALLAATVFETRRSGVRVIGTVVDHGLQDGSAEHTARVVAQMAQLGADETASIRVAVDTGRAGVEAGAREARYAALQQLAEHFAAERVLLGHTQDDQAETVLLGLTRGSGGRSIAGMRSGFHLEEPDPASDRASVYFQRPLLQVTRAQTEAACVAEDIAFWSDPHNDDPRFTRSRIRHTVLPTLERELGPGVAQALARTGEMLLADLNALDALAEQVWHDVRREDGIDTAHLASIDVAIRHRVIRAALIEAGVLRSDLSRDHVLAVGDLVLGDRDEDGKQIQLPGHLTAYRADGRLRFRRTDG